MYLSCNLSSLEQTYISTMLTLKSSSCFKAVRCDVRRTVLRSKPWCHSGSVRIFTRHDDIPAISANSPLMRKRSVLSRSYSIEGKIPEGVNFEVKPDSEGSEIEWDVDTKTLRIPLSAAEGEGLRRTKLVIFTCNKCGGRTARNVNPVAWEKGLVMGQCAHCEVWHVLSAKNKLIFEEIRYSEKGGSGARSPPPVQDSEAGVASAASAATPSVSRGGSDDSNNSGSDHASPVSS